MNEHENAIKIAVLNEQILGLREQQKAHSDTTNRRFDSIDAKLETLMATLNKGKGAYAVLFLLSGLIGAAFFKGASFILSAIKS